MQLKPFHRVTVALTTLMLSGLAAASEASNWSNRSDINLRPGVTNISHDVYHLHNLVLGICAAIGALVFVLILWSMIRHRRSVRPEPSKFHENLGLEILWTVVPFIILVCMAIPATRVLVKEADTSKADLTVQVTGHRWKWSYEYLEYKDDKDPGVFFFSQLATPQKEYDTPVLSSGLFPYGTAKDNAGKPSPQKDHNYLLKADRPLVIPAGEKVRFLITSGDVIHSFFVPDFGIKKDAIPGYENSVWTKVPENETGMYYGQCAELCGKGHAFMPINIKVVSASEFKTWLADQEKKAKSGPDLTPFSGLDQAMKVGKQVFDKNCAVCHGADGKGGVGPSFRGTPMTTDPKNRKNHIDTVINGRKAMPSWKAQLKPREIAAVVTYERNAWGNNTGDLIQPAEVQHEEK